MDLESKDISYFKNALALQGVLVSSATAEIVIQTYEKIKELGGDFSIRDAAEIRAGVEEKYNKENKNE